MRTYLEAVGLIERAAGARSEIEIENVKLEASAGRILARDLVGQELIPPFDNSAMDGFAVRSAQTKGLTLDKLAEFNILGRILAGDAPRTDDPPEGNVAWEIMTGAPFPAGFDACVRVEDTRVEGARLTLSSEVAARANRRLAGEDFVPGTLVAARGTRLFPEHILALASLGFAEVPVYRRLRVGLISTGAELVPVTSTPAPGQIRNSTASYLLAVLARPSLEVTHLGTIADDPAQFRALLPELSAYDLVLTTGAVSMGSADFVTHEIAAYPDAEILFHKAAIRPGKPILFASIQGGPDIFGLPGNPVSGVVGVRFFVEAYLRQRLGYPREMLRSAILAAAVKKPPGLRCFYKASIESLAGTTKIRVLPGQMSFMVKPLLESTAWAILPEDRDGLEAGEVIEYLPLIP